MEQFDDVTVRVYEPANDHTSRPGVMFYHGGGFTMHTPGKPPSQNILTAMPMDSHAQHIVYTANFFIFVMTDEV